MSCISSQTQTYTILFQKLADARASQEEAERDDTDRVMKESEEIRTVRELSEAVAKQEFLETYTRG
jgi:hypothetical protein